MGPSLVQESYQREEEPSPSRILNPYFNTEAVLQIALQIEEDKAEQTS